MLTTSNLNPGVEHGQPAPLYFSLLLIGPFPSCWLAMWHCWQRLSSESLALTSFVLMWCRLPLRPDQVWLRKSCKSHVLHTYSWTLLLDMVTCEQIGHTRWRGNHDTTSVIEVIMKLKAVIMWS